MNLTNTITLIIPTKNRPAFLKRLIHYYNETDFQGTLAIADSSDPPSLQATRKNLARLKPKFTLIHQEYPNLQAHSAIAAIQDSIETPYAAFLPDDDFLITAGLAKATHFLAHHPEYNGAWGKVCKVKLKNAEVHGQIAMVKLMEQLIVEEESGVQRFYNISKSFTPDVAFAVQRTENFKKMFRPFTGIRQTHEITGSYPNYVFAICGKVKQLDGLYLVRTTHSQRITFTYGTMFDAITKLAYTEYFPTILENLSKELVQQDGIALEDAKHVIKQGLWFNFTLLLNQSYARKYPQFPDPIATHYKLANRKTRENVLRILKPLSQRIWRKIQNLGKEPFDPQKISLDSLLDPASAYHHDFMPVYRTLTTPPPE